MKVFLIRGKGMDSVLLVVKDFPDKSLKIRNQKPK